VTLLLKMPPIGEAVMDGAGLAEPAAGEEALQVAPRVHAVRGRERVFLITAPEEFLHGVMEIEGHESRRERDGRPQIDREYDDAPAGLYELRERDRAIDRKLEVISRTVELLLGLLQTRSSLRVEWYIVILIVAELLLALYPLFRGL